MTGFPEIQINREGVCKVCAQGKNTKNPYLSSNSESKGVLDIVHSDVCRPMQTTSLRGYFYYASFIDYYSHKTWIYFLKKKDEVFEKFKEFKALVENLSEKRINTLRSYHGGEFTSGEFNDYCKEDGIKRELTIPYNPQQNFMVERKNRSIMELFKSIIHDQNLPMHLWVEESRVAVYV